ARAAAATMREIAADSAGGSALSDSTARLNIASSSGRLPTEHPRQTGTQKVARSLHAHLERRLPNPGDALDLVVAKAFHVMKEKDLAIVFWAVGERALDVLVPFALEDGIRAIRGCQSFERAIGGDVLRLAPLVSEVRTAAAVAEDAKEPGVEPLPLFIPRQR